MPCPARNPLAALGFILLLLLQGTAAARSSSDAPAGSISDQVRKGYAAARANHWDKAQAAFSAAVRQDLRNPRLHFLNGVAYEHLARRGTRDDLELARVGYENAARFGSGQFWPHLYLGFLELEMRDFVRAQTSFAAAARERPDRWEAFYGLGVASYYAGDVLTARLAAERCAERAPNNPTALRLAAFARAAAGDSDAEQVVQAFPRSDRDKEFIVRRVREVLRDTRLAQAPPPAQDEQQQQQPNAPSPDLESPDNQILVDVTIILSSLIDTRTRGINLFDGLVFQFSGSNVYNASRPSGGEWASNRSITSTISIPQLTYSLNLFNNSGQQYQVIARPSLTAFMGRESEFFAGRTINVKVSGVNLGTLQPIDVGVGLKVTPEVVDGDKVTFHVAASRSFLSKEEVGTFEESLTTFKQLVSATAQVQFGQTLLLSALSESVRDATYSKAPGLGDIPGPSLFFKQSVDSRRQESLIILLTPLHPTSIQTSAELRPAAVEALIDAWKNVVEPRSSVERILRNIDRQRFFRNTEAGDLRWSPVMSAELLDEAMRENVEMLGT
jgi:tetratricopeptide (TPR) repeat protein